MPSGARLPRRAACVLLLVCALLGGCTERETRSQYERRVTEAYKLRVETVRTIGAETSSEPYFRKAKASVDRAVTDLESISPPKDVERAHELYLRSLRGMSEVLATLARAAAMERRDPAAARSIRDEIETHRLDEIANDFAEAEAVYRDRGYDLPEVDGERQQ